VTIIVFASQEQFFVIYNVPLLFSSTFFFQIKKIKRSDAALRGELMPYNIVPLDAPSSVANIIGFFPEVWICTFGFD
jgi:hypothetical protein